MSEENPVSDIELLGTQESPLYTAKYDYRAQGILEYYKSSMIYYRFYD